MYAPMRFVLHLCILSHVYFLVASDSNTAHCNRMQAGGSRQTVKVGHSGWSPLNCNRGKVPLVVRAYRRSKRNQQVRIIIRGCPRVTLVGIYAQNSGHFKSAPPGGRLISCRIYNDTVLFKGFKRRVKKKLMLQNAATDTLGIVATYKEKNGNSETTWNTRVYVFDPVKRRPRVRYKRDTESVSDGNAETAVSDFPLYECASNRSCIRYGRPGCGHMECDYFLSYQVNSVIDTINLELSAKTSGWVAVGFSSDDRMGGGDDVIACKRQHAATDVIRVQSLWNSVPRSRPEVKGSALNLTKWRYQDGYIYCQVTRPLKVNIENNLELTNDWYQLYATGPIESSGVMLKHDKLPSTSSGKITVLRHLNIENTASATTGFYSYFMWACLLLTAGTVF